MATQTATVYIYASVTATDESKQGIGGVTDQHTLSYGTAAAQADKGYNDTRTIAYSSTPDGLDFAGGGLIDLVGDTITWVEIVFLSIKATSTNTVALTVGAHASPLNFGSGANTITVRPGETKVLINAQADGDYPISAGSTDTLKVAIASGTNQSYEILAIGRSA